VSRLDIVAVTSGPQADDGRTSRAVAGKVLVLAHRFPPTGGAGVQRNLQLARHLPTKGWSSTVITGPGPVEDRWLPTDGALSDGRLRTTVHRLPDTEPEPATARERRAERWLRQTSRWQRWWDENVLTAVDRIGVEADVIHASVAPYSTATTAIRVARKLRKPLILDFEDPWALDEMLVYPSDAHRRLELRRMGRALQAADAVVMNTPEARRRVLERFPDLRADRVFAITNAMDPADFEAPLSARTDGRFRILHTGSMHTDMGLAQRSASRARRLLGGQVDGVDFLTRSHVHLLEAVSRVLAARPELESKIEVLLAGVFTAEDRAVAARYPFVKLRDFVPHAETLALMRTADLLFLPMHDLPPGRRAGLVPHKTYEYIASGRPIVAAVPDGDARDLLATCATARLCRPSDSCAIAASIVDAVDNAFADARSVAKPSPEILAKVGSDRLVGELAAVFALVGRVSAAG
jgi:glycosyltransferase involved in cell wall biosynthesis